MRTLSMVSNPVRFAQFATAVIGIGLVTAAIALVDTDAARTTLVVLSAGFFLLAALLPLLTGRLKLGGAFEGELREDIAETLAEKGSEEGVQPEKIDRLARSVDEVLDRVSSDPQQSTATRSAKDTSVMVCADCGVIARLEPPPQNRLGAGRAVQSLVSPICRACGSMNFKLPE